MTSNRRTYDGRRRRGGHWRKDVSLFVLFTVACAVLAVVQLAERLWPLAVLAAAGYGGWRLQRRRHTRAQIMSSSPGRDRRVVPGSVVPDNQLAAVTAERDGLRLQVAKLEDQAAAHDDLLGRLERITRRPAELHVADLERAQGQYRRQP